MLDKYLDGLKEIKEILKENDFDTCCWEGDFLTIEFTEYGEFEIETPVNSYRAETLEKAISKTLENLQWDIDENRRDREEEEREYEQYRFEACTYGIF